MKQRKEILFRLCIIAVVAAWIVVVGCGTTDQGQRTEPKQNQPAKDKRPIEERLKVGMSKDEVRTAIGEPADKAVKSTGEESWTYKDTAKAFIPFYAISGGKFQFLTINFDLDGKVKDWSTSKHGMF